MSKIVTLKGPKGWRIELDPDQIIPDDPGAGTPFMVYGPGPEDSVTFHCAIGTGECSGTGEELPEDVLKWLIYQESFVVEWEIDQYNDHPQYAQEGEPASRAEQQQTYIDVGPAAWDDL